MRFLVIGAGALGGYFGARLLAAGEDVSFLVRPRRAAQLATTGLVVRSSFGNLDLPNPPMLTANMVAAPYDVIVVGCKAYDLAQTMVDFAPAVGPNTAILPLLNGLRHLDVLAERFGRSKVLGGLCQISAALNANGEIEHLKPLHVLAFGELDTQRSARVEALETIFNSAGFVGKLSADILQEMWEKWAFIATAAGITCLMRASIGDIVAAGAGELALELFAECDAIAAYNGHPSGPEALARAHTILTEPGSLLTASMFKDIERGASTEADHIIGELIKRAPQATERFPLLRVVHAHLRTYEARRVREAGG